jgi:hypothetical protein
MFSEEKKLRPGAVAANNGVIEAHTGAEEPNNGVLEVIIEPRRVSRAQMQIRVNR